MMHSDKHNDLLDNVVDGNADKSAIKCGYIYHTTSECLVQQQQSLTCIKLHTRNKKKYSPHLSSMWQLIG